VNVENPHINVVVGIVGEVKCSLVTENNLLPCQLNPVSLESHRTVCVACVCHLILMPALTSAYTLSKENT
jgi:hypothetical protein